MPSYEVGGYNLGIGYVDPSDNNSKNLDQYREQFYQANYTANTAIWQRGLIAKRFKVGDQSLYSQMYGLNTQAAQRFFFNLIKRHINMIAGFQRRNRKSTVTLPVHDYDDPLSDEYNKVIRYCEDRDGFQEYFSQSFENACDVGINWLWMYPDYAKDPISGDLFTDSVAWNNVLWDQYFRKQDLSDCNGIWRRRWTSKQGAKLLLPGYSKEIDRMKPGGMKDGRFPLQAELQNLAVNDLFTYDEFLYRDTRKATIVLDPYSGESVEWVKEEGDENDLMERTLAEQPWLKVTETQVPTVKLCIALGNKTIYDGPNQLMIDKFPCVPHLCYHEPDLPQYRLRMTGFIENMMDPQFLYNMRKVIELQILQSQVNAGWIYPVDKVVDPKSLRQASGGDGFLIALKAGSLPNEIQRIEPSAIPQSLMELSQSLAEDITKISGVTEELLGSSVDDKSGFQTMLRQSAGITTLQTVLDKSDFTQRLYGDIRIQAVRKMFSKGKIRNILGYDPNPAFFTANLQKYGLTVDEGNYAATQRQTELQQLLHFKEIGMNVADKTIWRAAIITNKKKAMQEAEEQQAQASKAAQAEAELKAKVENSKVMSAYAKSRTEMAKEKEIMAKIDQTYADAEHKRTQAELDLVKVMIELEDMDMNNLKNAWEMAQAIKQANKIEEEQVA